MKYVDVVIDNKSRMTDTYYTYLCDIDDICIGQKVYVPFARSKSLREGYVFDVRNEDKRDLKFKYIDHIDENICLNQEMVNTAVFMKKRYAVKYIDAVKCFVPPGNMPKRKLKEELEVKKNFEPKVLTDEQEMAVSKIRPSVLDKKHEIFLLHGVTSSGKTEVYMNIIDSCLEIGRTCIMMVPEISLTNQVIERFQKRYGSDIIAVMHSKITKAKRYAIWQKIRSGKIKIVIGARSAVFAPLENIGIIILDEEHESTYKSDMTPKYETIEIAIKRAKAYGASIILGSATPSVVSYQRAKDGIYNLISMKKRYNENLMPEVSFADMKLEMRKGNLGIFSEKLYSEMKKCLEDKKQVILFLNRRGYSTYLTCKECGSVIKCPVCGISMTYHKNMNGLSCHFCGKTMPLSNICSNCGGQIIMGGRGTEKIEEEIENMFPGFEVSRLDLDTISRKGSLEKILNDFRKRKTDILIGTQLVAKGLDFDNVGLVGILAPDNSLNIPDYRAAERTFQLITQASGRAGRGSDRGKVIIQTYDKNQYAVKYAALADYESFAKEELYLRKLMNYPPFSDIFRIIFTGKDEKEVIDISNKAYRYITSYSGKENIYMPQAAQVPRIDEIYRYNLMIKCPKGKRNFYLGIYKNFIDLIDDKCKVSIGIDINPYSFV